MLPSSDQRITSNVNAEPVDPAMAVEPTGPSVKAEPIEPSMKVKAEPTDSPIKVEPFDPDACIDTSNLSPGIRIKAEAVEPQIKVEPMGSKVKIEPMDVDIKVEPTDSKVKIEPVDVDIKEEPSDSKVKTEPVDVDIKVEPSDSKVKTEPMDVDIKVEPGEVQVKLEPKDPKVKMERMESDVKAEPLEPAIKAEAADPKIKIEPTAHDVKVEQVDSEVKKELEVKAEMEDVKAELADSTVKSEPVDTDSEDGSMDSEEAWFIQAARVERCKSLLRQYRDITLETYVHQRKAYKMRQLIEEEEAEERARQSGAGAVQAKSEIKDEVKSEEEDEKQMPGVSSGASTSAPAENSPSIKKEIRVKIEPRDPDFEVNSGSLPRKRLRTKTTSTSDASLNAPSSSGTKVKVEPKVKEEPVETQQSNDAGKTGKRKTKGMVVVKEEGKADLHHDVKKEVKTEVKEEEETSPKKLRLRKKTANQQRGKGDSAESKGVKVKMEPEDGFDVRLSYWIDMCIDFQKKKRTWHPGKPCCLPNLFLSPLGGPKRDELKPCWLRLSWQQRCDVREYVESGQVDRDFEWITSGLVCHKAETNAWQKFVHPQKNYSRPGSHAPRQRLPSDTVYEWSRELPRRMYKGDGWWLGPDGIRKMIKEKYSENRTDKFEVFESRGRAKVAQPSSSSVEQAQPSSVAIDSKAKDKKTKDVDSKFISGWPGITWNDLSGQWDVKWYEEKSNVYKVKGFHVFKHWEEHMGYDDALTVALNAAVDWQEQARAKGIIKQLQPKRKRDEPASSISPATTMPPLYATAHISCKQTRIGSQKRVVHVARKHTGVSHVSWIEGPMAYKVQWTTKERKRGQKWFYISTHLRPGMSAEQADEAAVNAAIAFRNKLVEEGLLQLRQTTKPSGVKGVVWSAKHQSWHAFTFNSNGKPKQKGFRVADDTPEAVEKARLAAVEYRRQWELKHLQIVQAQAPPNMAQVIEKRAQFLQRNASGVAGVSWNKECRFWEVRLGRANGKPLRERFMALDRTPGEIERARKLAVKRRLDFLKKGM